MAKVTTRTWTQHRDNDGQSLPGDGTIAGIELRTIWRRPRPVGLLVEIHLGEHHYRPQQKVAWWATTTATTATRKKDDNDGNKEDNEKEEEDDNNFGNDDRRRNSGDDECTTDDVPRRFIGRPT